MTVINLLETSEGSGRGLIWSTEGTKKLYKTSVGIVKVPTEIRSSKCKPKVQSLAQNHRTMLRNLNLTDYHILSTVRGPDDWDLAKVLENEWSTKGSCQDNF
jgi:hypothetical protein